ncbi:MAG TPA: nucleotide exchange factor GrpE [Phycisphaerales bacterium]|nr:nucleotide exchange factor GrpE [Phycisphaerales bacterium]
MSKTKKQGGTEQGAGADAVEMSAERAEEIVSLLRDGALEIPVGAEDLAGALLVVAGQRDENRDLLQRTAADFQNFQRRSRQNERETRELTSAGVVQSMLRVLDFFDMALQQDPTTATVEQVIGGVEMIKAEFLRVLSTHGVEVVMPSPGDEFEPRKHEAVEKRESADIEPGHIVEARSPGYVMSDRVIRPAKVVVAEAAGDGIKEEDGDGAEPVEQGGEG